MSNSLHTQKFGYVAVNGVLAIDLNEVRISIMFIIRNSKSNLMEKSLSNCQKKK